MPTLVELSLSFALVVFAVRLHTEVSKSLPGRLQVHEGLSSLPPTSKARRLYPEDCYPGGGYAALPWGRVRYWVMGPESGRKVVLIHGLTIPAIVWKYIASTLAKEGFRVLVYDLYGRGYSGAPETLYHTALYTTQLALLMQHLKWDKAYVVGFSMGGAIAAVFTAQFPQLVDDKVVFIASAGVMEPMKTRRIPISISRNLVKLPFARFFRRLDLTTKTEDESVAPIIEIVDLQSKHLLYYNTAVLSSLDVGPIRGEAKSFSSNAMHSRSVLIIQGDKDKIVHPRYAQKLHDLLPAETKEKGRAEIVMVSGANHNLTVTHPQVVAGRIVEFLK